jgi:hypothetical protein
MNLQFVVSRFRKVDPGKGHRPSWDKGDCQVRALSIATGLRYADAWDLLYQLQGRHRSAGFALDRYLDHDPEPLGVLRTLPFPAVKGERRMTVRRFCIEYPEGNFILAVAHHIVGVEDGFYYDAWDSGGKCVYKAWEVRALTPASANGRATT